MDYDLIVIGGGPGGYSLAIRMAGFGWKVAVVEEDKLGGTCLNWGCIPTKALLSSAKNFNLLKNAQSWGLTCAKPGFSWEMIQKRKNEIVQKLRCGIESAFRNLNVEWIRERAILEGDRVCSVSGKWKGKGKKICLAVGSKPWRPKFFATQNLWTSDEAVNSPEIPDSLLIIGGGVIGLELGQVFREFGSNVTIVEMQNQILPGLDSMVAKRILPEFKKSGLEIYLGKKIESVESVNDVFQVEISGNKRTFQKVLLAMGRKTNLSFFGEKKSQLSLKENFIKVNTKFETNIENLYAIGDCIAGPMLAHRASYDALILSQQLTGKEIFPKYENIPSCVYTHPEIAWVGKSEDQLIEEKTPYKTGRSLFSTNGKALACGEPVGQIKTMISETGKLLGSVFWGPEVSNLIPEATILAQLGITNTEFETVVYPHPTLSEAFFESFESISSPK